MSKENPPMGQPDESVPTIPAYLLRQIEKFDPFLWQKLLAAEMAAAEPSEQAIPLAEEDALPLGSVTAGREIVTAMVFGLFAGLVGATPALPDTQRPPLVILAGSPRVQHLLTLNPDFTPERDGDDVPPKPNRPLMTDAEAAALGQELEIPHFLRALQRQRRQP